MKTYNGSCSCSKVKFEVTTKLVKYLNVIAAFALKKA